MFVKWPYTASEGVKAPKTEIRQKDLVDQCQNSEVEGRSLDFSFTEQGAPAVNANPAYAIRFIARQRVSKVQSKLVDEVWAYVRSIQLSLFGIVTQCLICCGRCDTRTRPRTAPVADLCTSMSCALCAVRWRICPLTLSSGGPTSDLVRGSPPSPRAPLSRRPAQGSTPLPFRDSCLGRQWYR